MIRLGQELGRGGEGVVYAVEARKDRVAKLYHQAPPQHKIRKLHVMAQRAAPDLLRVAAWPTDMVVDGNGTVRGFIMPAIRTRQDIHELYSPKSRFDAFPEADFRFIVHVAANLARVFAVVHGYGHVVGDVNHGSVLVGPDGTVILVDCDSFQIKDDSNLFTCDVGVPLFTAPELQGRSFRGLIRTPSHDEFGMAVLLFHLLFMGRHPYAGRYLGPGEMPIERAIAECRFAYGSGQLSRGMERPPGTLPLDTMGFEVARLFGLAFGEVGSTTARPDARAWIGALGRLKNGLRTCGKVSRHHLPGHLSSCPWCGLEAKTGVILFGQKILTMGPAGAVDLAALWRAIEAVPDPGADPSLPSERNPLPQHVRPSARKILRFVVSALLMLGGVTACNAIGEDGGLVLFLLLAAFSAVAWPRVPRERLAEANREVAAARVAWDRVVHEFHKSASRGLFVAELEELRKARTELMDLPNERTRRLAQLNRDREQRQQQRYLDRFRIDRARIPKIGPGRTAMLASYGIESAADVGYWRIQRIPGFGEVLASELEAWKDHHARNFRFNPGEPVDPRDIAALDQELRTRRQGLIDKLGKGPGRLRNLQQRITMNRPRFLVSLESAWSALLEAEARRKAL